MCIIEKLYYILNSARDGIAETHLPSTVQKFAWLLCGHKYRLHHSNTEYRFLESQMTADGSKMWTSYFQSIQSQWKDIK